MEAVLTKGQRDYAKYLEKEIAKCEIRCANCHRRKTAKQMGYL